MLLFKKESDFSYKIMNATPLFTVCTPTFNRASLLPRVYRGLLDQTFTDFEWLVVDDGSTDETGEVIKKWQSEAPFRIRYIWKENGGKHSAHNASVREARGKLFVMIDSDDWMLPRALEVMESAWRQIETREDYSGICCLFQYEDGTIVGDRFPKHGMESNAIDLRFNHGISGDKMGFTKTEILRRFQFPGDLGRNLIPESLVWNRISQQYQMRCTNDVVGVKEYQLDGLTDLSVLNSYRNPSAYYLLHLELLNGRVPLRFSNAARIAISLAKCSTLAKKSPLAVKPLLYRALTLSVMPLGLLLAFRDWRRARNIGRSNRAGKRSKIGVRIRAESGQ